MRRACTALILGLAALIGLIGMAGGIGGCGEAPRAATPLEPVPAEDAAPPAAATAFDVVMTSSGPAKIQAIAAVRRLLGLGLAESKKIVDRAPTVIGAGLSEAAAAEMAAALRETGATVEIRPGTAPPAEAGGAAATSFSVVIRTVPTQKIMAIKAVRQLTRRGLKDAKDLIESAPAVVAGGLSKAAADEMVVVLEAAGVDVELRPE